MPFKDNPIEGFDCSVIKSWTATYPDPIQVVEGEPIELDGRTDVWDGHTWLWAKSRNGKEGWIPDCIVSETNPVTATEDYTAMELTCHKGETLWGEKVQHGWVFCSIRNGQRGWVPERNIRIIDRS